jgi:hypothetical protein
MILRISLQMILDFYLLLLMKEFETCSKEFLKSLETILLFSVVIYGKFVPLEGCKVI